MSPPGGFCEALINPANERLIGTKLPYFPKGGPVPEEKVLGAAAVQRDWLPPGFVSQWGGMEIGGQMLYPISVVDGMVGMLGGRELRRECASLAVLGPAGSDVRCPIGDAVRTGAPGGLKALFGAIVHTVPPFFARTAAQPAPEWRSALRRCWLRALDVAEPSASIAAPLLGAGARGAPTEEAASVAADAAAEWLWSSSGAAIHAARVLHLTVQTEDVATLLARELEIATGALAGAALDGDKVLGSARAI
jgi:O-acetyl-ADP-ribose deacetylase (regulator of RNase III)